jgi:hypothetical protein
MSKRNELQKDIDTFIANGGTIEALAYDESAERIGRWAFNDAMGDKVHDQVERRKYGEDLIEAMELDEVADPYYEEERRDEYEKASWDALRDAMDFFNPGEYEEWE